MTTIQPETSPCNMDHLAASSTPLIVLLPFSSSSTSTSAYVSTKAIGGGRKAIRSLASSTFLASEGVFSAVHLAVRMQHPKPFGIVALGVPTSRQSVDSQSTIIQRRRRGGGEEEEEVTDRECIARSSSRSVSVIYLPAARWKMSNEDRLLALELLNNTSGKHNM